MRKLFLSSAGAATLLIAVHLYTLDGLHGWVLSLAWKHDTQFASGYSPVAWRRVHSGMSPAEVTSVLGPPLETYDFYGTTGWRYSRSPSDASYFNRVILFRDDRIYKRFSEFYLD